MSHEYLFTLGNHPTLSAAEIRAVFSLLAIPFTTVEETSVRLEVRTDRPINPTDFMDRLGGTIQIGKSIGTGAATALIPTYLCTHQPAGKIQFSLHGERGRLLAQEIKKQLRASGRSARYIEPKNTATILHNNLVGLHGDFTITPRAVFVTEAIQPIEALGARDFGRPVRDAKSGMLPPKLAKIMINLAEIPTNGTLCDPFCGSGTILMEALLMGYHMLIGSDISEKAVADTKKNLQWLHQHEHFENAKLKNIKILQSDARALAKKLPARTIDAIITEPYLGQPLTGKESKKFLDKQIEDLRALYQQAVHALLPALKPGGHIVMILPAFRFENSWISVPAPLSGSATTFFYARPNQHVGRQIWQWKNSSGQ